MADGPDALQLAPGDTLAIDAPAEALTPRCTVPVRPTRRNGEVLAFDAQAAVETRFEVDLLRVGGVIPAILRRTLQENPATHGA